MFKKILALVMCLVLMCGTGLIANAETTENQVQPRYNYTNIISATQAKSAQRTSLAVFRAAGRKLRLYPLGCRVCA